MTKHTGVDPTVYYASEEVASRYEQAQVSLFGGERRFLDCFFPAGMAGVQALDLGCGGGRFTYWLHQRGAEVAASDITYSLLTVGRRRLPDIPYAQGDAAHLSFPDDFFDLVAFAYNGLDYISPGSRRTQTLAEIYRVLRPGGLVLFSSHSFGGLTFGLARHLRKPRSLIKSTLFALRHLSAGTFFHPQAFIPDVVDGIMTYHAWPARVLADCRSAGFDVLAVYPNLGLLGRVQDGLNSDWLTRLCEPWPYYVCQKPQPG